VSSERRADHCRRASRTASCTKRWCTQKLTASTSVRPSRPGPTADPPPRRSYERRDSQSETTDHCDVERPFGDEKVLPENRRYRGCATRGEVDELGADCRRRGSARTYPRKTRVVRRLIEEPTTRGGVGPWERAQTWTRHQPSEAGADATPTMSSPAALKSIRWPRWHGPDT